MNGSADLAAAAATGHRVRPAPPARPWAAAGPGRAGLGGLLDRHRVFVAALVGALALRVCAMFGYRWVGWFNDSFDYLALAEQLRPHPVRPIGYPVLLAVLRPLGQLAAISAVQHALGLGVAVAVYALLRRFGLPGGWATAAAAPVLFDAYQIQLEHLILADVLFTALVTAAVTVALWRSVPSPTTAAVSAGLLALAALTRTIGLALVLVLLGHLLVRRAGARVLIAATAAGAAPLLLFASWYHSEHGRFALNDADGVFLWGRVAAFADCARIAPPERERWLCPRLPPELRRPSSTQIWRHDSPFHGRAGGGAGADAAGGTTFHPADNDLALRFAWRAIRAQPGDYAAAALTGVGRTFTWSRQPYPTVHTSDLYRFGRSPPALATAHGQRPTREVRPYAGLLRGYQHAVFLPGMVFGLVLLAGAAGLTVSRRAGGSGPARQSIGLLWGCAVVLVVVPPLTVDFDYRYVLPAVPLGCAAAALAVARLVSAGGLSDPDTGRPGGRYPPRLRCTTSGGDPRIPGRDARPAAPRGSPAGATSGTAPEP